MRAEMVIAGAGVGGLLAAIILARKGLRSVVFERAPTLRPAGGALILWCNALKALERTGLRQPLLAAPSTQVVDLAEFRRHDGEFLTSLPIGEIGDRHQAETIVISRGDLLATLHAHARETAEIRFGIAVAGFRAEAEEVVVRLSDGGELRASGLVGADGLGSMVRQCLRGTEPLRQVRQELWVGIAAWERGGLRPGVTIASVGAGDRFWHTLLGDGRMFWYAAVTSRGPLREVFARWHDPIPAIVEMTREEDRLHTSMRDRSPALPWGSGRVTLLGDAAHPMTPDIGQGACQAIESAVVLGDCVAPGRPLADAFREYERRRFPRTADLTRLSWLVAHSSGVANPTACALRDLAMRFGMRSSVMSQLDWIFAGC